MGGGGGRVGGAVEETEVVEFVGEGDGGKRVGVESRGQEEEKDWEGKEEGKGQNERGGEH